MVGNYLFNLYSEDDILTFNSLENAEKKIGNIKTPHLPGGYHIYEITYYNDGITHPVTKVFYEKGKHQIIFMETSGRYSEIPSEMIYNDKISDIDWISNDNEFILKWRESNQHSFKYLITNNKTDKSWIISVAENYSTNDDPPSNNHGKYFIITD